VLSRQARLSDHREGHRPLTLRGPHSLNPSFRSYKAFQLTQERECQRYTELVRRSVLSREAFSLSLPEGYFQRPSRQRRGQCPRFSSLFFFFFHQTDKPQNTVSDAFRHDRAMPSLLSLSLCLIRFSASSLFMSLHSRQFQFFSVIESLAQEFSLHFLSSSYFSLSSLLLFIGQAAGVQRCAR